jgi:hypothetical protein
MSKVTAPLLGFGASGQIGKTQVYGSWRGVKYARRYVVPSNPRSGAQTQTRGVFDFLNQVWKLMPGAVQSVWTLYAKGKPFTNRNGVIAKNLSVLRGDSGSPTADLAPMIVSPGVNGGLVAAGMSVTDATGHIATVTLVAPALPDGWAIVAEHALLITQQEAATGTAYQSYYGTDAVSPYAAPVNTGVAGTFAAFAWFEYTKADGSTAYGPSSYHAITLA